MTANLSYAQLEGVWDQAAAGTPYAGTNASPVPGATWDELMAAIAEAESRGNQTAENTTDNSGKQTSWGLWQISLGNHNAPAPNWSDPVENADLAIGKLQSQGLGAWGTYDTGAYKSFLSTSTPAVTTSDTGGGSGSPYSNVQWWNPVSWLNVPGDAAASTAQTVTTDITHAAAIALAVIAGLGIIGLGLARATHAREHAENFADDVQQRGAQVASVAAIAA